MLLLPLEFWGGGALRVTVGSGRGAQNTWDKQGGTGFDTGRRWTSLEYEPGEAEG